jgi:hypothetical protein
MVGVGVEMDSFPRDEKKQILRGGESERREDLTLDPQSPGAGEHAKRTKIAKKPFVR